MYSYFYGRFIFSMLLCFIITFLPLPAFLHIPWFIPALLYWSARYPEHISVVSAFIIGFIFDVVAGSLLGSMGLSMAIMVTMLHFLRPAIFFFRLMQQVCIIWLIVSIGLLLHFWIQLFSERPIIALQYVSATLITAMVWPVLPWIFKVMRRSYFTHG